MPNVFKSVFRKNIPSTAGFTLYTAPSATTTVIKSLYTANTSGSTLGVDVFVGASGSTASFFIVKNTQVSPQTTLQSIVEPVVLQNGDRIYVQPTSSNAIDAVLSFMEVS